MRRIRLIWLAAFASSGGGSPSPLAGYGNDYGNNYGAS